MTHEKGKRKVQVVPHTQAASLPRHQEEETKKKKKKKKNKKKKKKKKNKQKKKTKTKKKTSANQTNVRKALRLALSSPSEVITMLKGLKTQE